MRRHETELMKISFLEVRNRAAPVKERNRQTDLTYFCSIETASRFLLSTKHHCASAGTPLNNRIQGKNSKSNKMILQQSKYQKSQTSRSITSDINREALVRRDSSDHKRISGVFSPEILVENIISVGNQMPTKNKVVPPPLLLLALC